MDSSVTWLVAWMQNQRWYARKGSIPALTEVGSFELAGADVRRVWIQLVRDDVSVPPVTYQIPLVHRDAALVGQPVVAVLPDGSVVTDGTQDPAFTQALWQRVTTTASANDLVSESASQPPTCDGMASVLTGEQSNTSLIYASEPTGVIVKVFRQVSPGINPDIELQTALSAAGCSAVPRVVGSLTGSWKGATEDTVASLAFAQEFIPGVQDAWRTALTAASVNRDFTARAAELGATTAEVHQLLGTIFGNHVATDDVRQAIRAAWNRRLTIAVNEVAALADVQAAIVDVYDRAMVSPWPALQRVHGDYHLGQVLDVPDRGWVLLDFEGEPMRPMTERRAPDLALRDVAGMLRSFDYVAGSVGLVEPAMTRAADGWAAAARAAFCDGYSRVTGSPLESSADLLAALELDKAVYEAIYETRNRPAWAGLPLAAIGRLIA